MLCSAPVPLLIYRGEKKTLTGGLVLEYFCTLQSIF